MKKFFILLISLIAFNFSFCDEMDIRVNKLKEKNILKIESGVAYIKKSEWMTMARNEKINFLEELNKYSRFHKEKHITVIKEMDTKEELMIIGVFGIEIKEESG